MQNTVQHSNVWNYYDKDGLNVPAARATVSVKGISSKMVLLTHYRIDPKQNFIQDDVGVQYEQSLAKYGYSVRQARLTAAEQR
jgi:hypothetical protein